MGGAPPLLAMNGRGYTVLHVHNESSTSGQSTRTSSMGGAPPLLAMNGRGYTVLMRALQVDRLQRRRDLATAETGEDREAQ